ncbi:MAG: patatin-like phospholipase family protein [Gemmataceae bacterium]|nr:patatin-like phospholipase family protein [Gemmataceae bacterium]
MRSRVRVALPVCALVALAFALGCASRRPFPTPSLADLQHDWKNRTQPNADTTPNADETVVRGLADALGADPGPVPPQPVPAPGRPLHVMVLSGGGKYGAFSSGVLAGWTANGTRPTFDVATGISSGAIMAPAVFLGPQYDEAMRRNFTTLETRDLFRVQPVRGLMFHNAVASSAPLKRLIDREISDEIIAGLRQAHAEGRRVYVATNNQMTHRLTIWDLTAIAAGCRPDSSELIRKVILAACSAPAFLPAVEFDVTVNGVRYHELHNDAGNVCQGFVRTPDGLPAGSDVYCICAGYLYTPPRTDPPRFRDVLGRAVSDSLDALFRADLRSMYALTAVSKSRFHLLAMPPSLQIKPGSMAFDPADSRLMYDAGYQMGKCGPAWRPVPPATDPGEPVTPRMGLDFVTPQ